MCFCFILLISFIQAQITKDQAREIVVTDLGDAYDSVDLYCKKDLCTDDLQLALDNSIISNQYRESWVLD